MAVVYIFIVQRLEQLNMHSGEFAQEPLQTKQSLHGDVVFAHRSCFLCTQIEKTRKRKMVLHKSSDARVRFALVKIASLSD